MDVHAVAQKGEFRLVRISGTGRFAVVRVGPGRVYSTRHSERVAEDTPAGMASVVSPDEWQSEAEARARLGALVELVEDYQRKVWE